MRKKGDGPGNFLTWVIWDGARAVHWEGYLEPALAGFRHSRFPPRLWEIRPHCLPLDAQDKVFLSLQRRRKKTKPGAEQMLSVLTVQLPLSR